MKQDMSMSGVKCILVPWLLHWQFIFWRHLFKEVSFQNLLGIHLTGCLVRNDHNLLVSHVMKQYLRHCLPLFRCLIFIIIILNNRLY